MRSISLYLFGDEEARIFAEALEYAAEVVKKKIAAYEKVNGVHPVLKRTRIPTLDYVKDTLLWR